MNIGINTKMRLSATMLLAQTAYASLYGDDVDNYDNGYRSVNNSPNLRGIDLKKEYELIIKKESNLSSNLRKKVVYLVEKES